MVCQVQQVGVDKDVSLWTTTDLLSMSNYFLLPVEEEIWRL